MEYHENNQLISPEKASPNTPYFVLANKQSLIIPGVGEKVDGKWNVQWFSFSENYMPIYNKMVADGLEVWAVTPTLPKFGSQPE